MKAILAAESVSRQSSDMETMKHGFSLLKWMLGVDIAFSIAMFWKLFA